MKKDKQNRSVPAHYRTSNIISMVPHFACGMILTVHISGVCRVYVRGGFEGSRILARKNPVLSFDIDIVTDTLVRIRV